MAFKGLAAASPLIFLAVCVSNPLRSDSPSFVNLRLKARHWRPPGGTSRIRAKELVRESSRSVQSVVGFGTVRFANNAVLLVVAISLMALRKSAMSAWIGLALHAFATGVMRGFRCPIKIPSSFRLEARSNLAKSYIAQVILLSLALTSASPTSAMVSKYLLFALVFVTSIFFDWPDPPLMDQAPDLVFPGAIPKMEGETGDGRSASSRFIMRLVGILLLTKLLSSQTTKSALSWSAAFFAHCVVIYLAASRTKR